MPIANHFFPAIDYLTLEGEEAGDIANHELLTSGSGIVFTGTGYYRVTEGSAMVNFGDITPPASGQYEILFRYNLQGILTFDNVTLIIRAGSEDGTGAAMCRNGSELPVGDSTFQYTSWPLGISITISQVICLRGGRKYTFIIQEFSSGQTGEDITFLIDSLVAIPLDIPGSQVLSDITLSGEYSNCVDRWRSVLTQTSARLDCEDITFALSTELYNGTLRELCVHMHIMCVSMYVCCRYVCIHVYVCMCACTYMFICLFVCLFVSNVRTCGWVCEHWL